MLAGAIPAHGLPFGGRQQTCLPSDPAASTWRPILPCKQPFAPAQQRHSTRSSLPEIPAASPNMACAASGQQQIEGTACRHQTCSLWQQTDCVVLLWSSRCQGLLPWNRIIGLLVIIAQGPAFLSMLGLNKLCLQVQEAQPVAHVQQGTDKTPSQQH